jgi:hypothetical protein
LLVDHVQLGKKWYHKDCVSKFPEAFFIDDDEVADETPTAKLQFTPYDQKHSKSNSNASGFYTMRVDDQSVGSYSSYAYKFDYDDDEDLSDEADATGLHADAYAQVTGDSEDEENAKEEIKSNIPSITVSVGYANDKKPSYMASGSPYEANTGGTYANDNYESSEEDKSPSTSPKVTITPRNYHENMSNNQNEKDSDASDLVTKSNSLSSMTNLHDWNKEYQQILSEMPYGTIDQKIEKEHKICSLVDEFKKVVDRVGRKIIDEIHKPVMYKTYKPLDAGGVAGGQKYVAENIFFKLCIDLNGIYGDDEYARKVSNMELIGLSAYLRCQQAVTPDLRLPFMALLDYRGYRLLAISVLPIGKDTLVYGSGDAGHTIKKDDALVNEWMERCAKYLNIKPHLVSKKKVLLSAAADIEVHKGNDGYYYILDTARVLPPEQAVDQYTAIKIVPKSTNSQVLVKLDVTKKDLKAIIGDDLQVRVLGEGSLFYEDKGELNPIASALAGFKVKGAAYLIYGSERRFLFYLLRPELVSQYKSPLSPDAFSGFGAHDEHYREHNAEVTEATNFLRHTVLTQFSEDLKSNKIYVTSRKELVREMHSHGINIRYLGLLRSLIHKVPRLQAITMLEMILRCIKNYVGRKFRKMKDNWKLVVVKYLNVFLGNSPQAKFYWSRLIKVQIEAKFGQYGPSLTSRELEAKTDLSDIYPKHLLFLDLAEMLGIELDPRTHCEVLSNAEFFGSPNPITDDMIVGLKGNIKMPAFGDQSLVKRLLKMKAREEFPSDRTDQLKYEVKLMKEFFGSKSAEQLKASIRLAQYLCSVERLDEALQVVTENFKEFSAMEKCNALLPLRLYLHLAEIQFKKGNFVDALFNIFRTLRLVGLSARVTMKNIDHNAAIECSFHPVFIAVLNYMMFIEHQTESLALFMNWIYIMYGVERMFPFPGTSEDFQKIFGYPHSFTPVAPVDFEGAEYFNKLQPNFKYGIHKTTLQKWYKKVFSMKDAMVYDVIPSLLDMETVPVEKLFSFSSAQESQLIHPTILMRGQPFDIVAIIPPSCGGTNHSIVFYKDGSIWCEKMQKYEEFFTVLTGGFIRRCTIGKEFWDICPENTEKVGISLRYVDSWGAQGFLHSAEMSIGTPDSLQMAFLAEKTFMPVDSREQLLPLIQFHQATRIASPLKIERQLGIVSGWSSFQRNKHYLVTEEHKVLMFGNSVEYAPTTTITSVPTPVEGLLGKEIVQIVGANSFGGDNYKQPFYAAVSKRGLLYTFGNNADGALGLGFGGSTETNARLVQGLLTVKIARVEAGHSFTVALARDGKAFIWGQLGERELSSYPKLIHFSEGKGEDRVRIRQISAAGSRCTFLTEHGTFFFCGELFPAPKRTTDPVEFVWLKEYKHGNKKIKFVQCGVMHTVFVTEDDEVFCFGDNSLNQCVTQAMTWPHEHMQPLRFVYAGKERKLKVKQLVGLNGYTALLTTDGQVWLWGSSSVYPRYQPVTDNYGNHIPVVAIGAEGRNMLGIYFKLPFNTNLPIDLPVIPEEQKFSHYNEDLALPSDAQVVKQQDMTMSELVNQQQEVIEKLQEENKDLRERLRVIEQFIKAPPKEDFALDRY